jgi:hypothetical protein
MKKGQLLQDGLSDLLQNCRVGRSCCADHFVTYQIFDIINDFWVITQNLQFYNVFYF